MTATTRFRIVGAGRAGQSFATALSDAEWDFAGFVRRGDALSGAAEGVDVVMLAVPDDKVADVAAAIDPTPATVICHIAGSRTLADLAPHTNIGSVHPLMSLPDGVLGAQRLADECTFAVCGSPVMGQLVEALNGNLISIADNDRGLYHATAAVAANHLVALCGQVERLTQQLGVPADGFWKMMETSLENAATSGPQSALTGPVARGDWGTIATHLAALPDEERQTYLSLAHAAATLAGRGWPDELPLPGSP